MGLPLTPMAEMLGRSLKGVPTMINSYMTWDGVAYIGTIVLFASLNSSTRNRNTDILISRPHLPQADRPGGMRKAA